MPSRKRRAWPPLPARAPSREPRPDTPPGSPACWARAGTCGASNSSRSASGPTYGAAASLLPPLLYARAPGKKALTDSGVYYLPFGQPQRGAGCRDGRAARRRRQPGDREPRRRAERSRCSSGRPGRSATAPASRRLAPARLADGWLPILETGYVDAAGVRYRQESFAAQDAKAGGLASFIRLEVDARTRAVVRLRPTKGRALVFRVPAGTTTIYAGWLDHPRRARVFAVDQARYDAARAGLVAYWEQPARRGRPGDGPRGAGRTTRRATCLIQNLMLTWRYSIGNPYEQFSFPEGVDVAQVMGEWGQRRRARDPADVADPEGDAVPELEDGREARSARRRSSGSSRDRAYVRQATPKLRGYVDALGRQITTGRDRPARPRALLVRHPTTRSTASTRRPSSGQGLRAMAASGRETGQPRARRARAAGSPRGSRAACGGRSASRSGGCRTARSSSRCSCSATRSRTAR